MVNLCPESLLLHLSCIALPSTAIGLKTNYYLYIPLYMTKHEQYLSAQAAQ